MARTCAVSGLCRACHRRPAGIGFDRSATSSISRGARATVKMRPPTEAASFNQATLLTPPDDFAAKPPLDLSEALDDTVSRASWAAVSPSAAAPTGALAATVRTVGAALTGGVGLPTFETLIQLSLDKTSPPLPVAEFN